MKNYNKTKIDKSLV